VVRSSCVRPLLLLLLLAPVLALPPAAAAQEPEPPRLAANAVYLELGGYGGLYSLNYDRRFGERVSVRAGFADIAVTGWDGTHTSILAFPVGLNLLIDPETLGEGLSVLFGGAHRMIELGPGLVVGREGRWQSGASGERHPLVALTGTLGFRLQRPTPGWVLRMGLTPLIPIIAIEETLFSGLSAGISVGYAF
jgi:hypothetical protein